jgi:cytochrome d ubiquinol oxidase subunit II
MFCIVVRGPLFRPFGSIMTTLAIHQPGVTGDRVAKRFAFRHEAEQLSRQRLFGAVFAISSVLTPFFFGTVVGGIISGRVRWATPLATPSPVGSIPPVVVA